MLKTSRTLIAALFTAALAISGCAGQDAAQATRAVACYNTGASTTCVESFNDILSDVEDVDGDGQQDALVCGDVPSESDSDGDDQDSDTDAEEAEDEVVALEDGTDGEEVEGGEDGLGDIDEDGDADSASDSDEQSESDTDCGASDADDADSDSASDEAGDGDGDGIADTADCDCIDEQTPPAEPQDPIIIE
jgi:hypothetical protein